MNDIFFNSNEHFATKLKKTTHYLSNIRVPLSNVIFKNKVRVLSTLYLVILPLSIYAYYGHKGNIQINVLETIIHTPSFVVNSGPASQHDYTRSEGQGYI